MQVIDLVGARSRSRTGTTVRSRDFKFVSNRNYLILLG